MASLEFECHPEVTSKMVRSCVATQFMASIHKHTHTHTIQRSGLSTSLQSNERKKNNSHASTKHNSVGNNNNNTKKLSEQITGFELNVYNEKRSKQIVWKRKICSEKKSITETKINDSFHSKHLGKKIDGRCKELKGNHHVICKQTHKRTYTHMCARVRSKKKNKVQLVGVRARAHGKERQERNGTKWMEENTKHTHKCQSSKNVKSTIVNLTPSSASMESVMLLFDLAFVLLQYKMGFVLIFSDLYSFQRETECERVRRRRIRRTHWSWAIIFKKKTLYAATKLKTRKITHRIRVYVCECYFVCFSVAVCLTLDAVVLRIVCCSVW